MQDCRVRTIIFFFSVAFFTDVHDFSACQNSYIQDRNSHLSEPHFRSARYEKSLVSFVLLCQRCNGAGAGGGGGEVEEDRC